METSQGSSALLDSYLDECLSEVETSSCKEVEVLRLVKIFTEKDQLWDKDLLKKLSFIKTIEIHLSGWVYKGEVSWFSVNSENLILRTRFLSAVKNERVSLVYLQDIPEFILEECRRPNYLCEENGCDVSYFGFRNGHVVLSIFNFFMTEVKEF